MSARSNRRNGGKRQARKERNFLRVAPVGSTPESGAWVDATGTPGSENRIAPPSAGPDRPHLTIVKGQVHATTAVKLPRTPRGYVGKRRQIVLGQSIGD